MNTENDSVSERDLTSKKKFPAGRYIFREGEAGDSAFVVTEGNVEIVRASAGGGEVVLGTIGPGGMFGEMALIDNHPRMASARAIGDEAEVMVISRQMLHKKLETADPFHRALIDILTNHVRSLADQLVKLGVKAS